AFVLVALVIIALVPSTSMVESRQLSNPSNLMSLEARLKVSGNGCCKAIKVIGHDCWPNVVASLGFTNEETYTLEGYCDEVEDAHSPP
ncbi:egg cell-secreted protein 1.1-like, partial [Trifolium medium]|nr:egg cell-secreted protein 1.1-like [Trifolium medium]